MAAAIVGIRAKHPLLLSGEEPFIRVALADPVTEVRWFSMSQTRA